jgi:hypothetical protein
LLGESPPLGDAVNSHESPILGATLRTDLDLPLNNGERKFEPERVARTVVNGQETRLLLTAVVAFDGFQARSYCESPPLETL